MKLHKIVLLFMFCMVHALFANAQKRIDSLKTLLAQNSSDSVKINVYNDLALAYYRKDSAVAFNYLNQAVALSRKTKRVSGEIESLLIKGAYFNFRYKGKEALIPLNEGYQLVVSTKNAPLQVKVLQEIAQAYYTSSQYREAISFLKKAEGICTATNNLAGLEKTYSLLGINHSELGEFEIGVNYLLKSLAIKEQTKNYEAISSLYNNLGNQFFKLKNYDESIKYLDKGIAISKRDGDYRTYGISLVNTANVFITQGKYAEAEDRLSMAIESFEKIDFKRGLQTVYNNLGAIQLRQDQFEKAIVYLEKALLMANTNQGKQGVALIEHNIGFAYKGLKNYSESLKWYVRAEKTADQFKADALAYTDIYKNRASLDSAMGNFESAYQYKTKFQNLYEKSLNDKSISTVNELNTKYETEKKQLQINLLAKQDSLKGLTIVQQDLALTNNLLKISNQNLALSEANNQIAEDSLQLSFQQKQLLTNKLQAQQKEEQITLLSKEQQIQKLAVKNKNYAIAGIATALLLLSLAGISYFRNYRLKQQKLVQATLHQQQQQATIAILTAEEKERKRIAGDLHDGIGQTMMAAWLNLQAIQNNTATPQEKEQLLQKAMLLVDESCKDVRAVSHNMMPNALLKKGLVNAVKEFIQQIDETVITINVHSEGLNKELPAVTETILYRVIQESVNNVVKHAKATLLDISILNEADGIDVLIEDNGKGFDVLQALQQQGGLGLSNIKSRIEYLKGTVEWSSSAQTGTLVAIHIPV